MNLSIYSDVLLVEILCAARRVVVNAYRYYLLLYIVQKLQVRRHEAV